VPDRSSAHGRCGALLLYVFMTNLNDTSIIITGGFGVLGVATAFSACRRGARVALIVNTVLPSIIDTPANREDMPTADFSTWVSPEALAEVILFLASKSAQAVTGALVPITGRAGHTHSA